MPELNPIGVVHSPLHRREDAPRQPFDSAPDAWLEIAQRFAEGIVGITVGSDILVLTWLHMAKRDTLKVRPRRVDPNADITGVFATRSPDRPNPIGLHRTTVVEIDPQRGIRVDHLEALDGTPILDIKPTLRKMQDS